MGVGSRGGLAALTGGGVPGGMPAGLSGELGACGVAGNAAVVVVTTGRTGRSSGDGGAGGAAMRTPVSATLAPCSIIAHTLLVCLGP